MFTNVRKIYFDMDDTIADFSSGLREICGVEPIPQEKSTPEQDNAMWAAVREAGNFYYRLKECTPGMTLLKKLRTVYGSKVEILTAVPKAKRGITTAEKDKCEWVKEHIGTDIIVNIVHSASEKKLLAGPGCFLVDDLETNIQEWRIAGGTGIWFRKNDMAQTKEEVLKTGILDRKIDLAFALASYAHADAVDKAGVDYIEHPKTVAANFTDESRVIVALLHDILEDTDVTEDTLRNLFGDEIADACRALTHTKGEPYLDYVRRAIQNPIARDVKRADLLNNMNLGRLDKITMKDLQRLQDKYIPAMELLIRYEEAQKNNAV